MKKKQTTSTIKTLAFALGCSTILAAPSLLQASSLTALEKANASGENNVTRQMTNSRETVQSNDDTVTGSGTVTSSNGNPDMLPMEDAMPDSPANESSMVSDEEMQELTTDMRTITLEVSSDSEATSPVPFQVLFNDEVIGEAEALPAENGENQRVSFEVPESSLDTERGFFDFGSDVKQNLTIRRGEDAADNALYVHSIDTDGKKQNTVSNNGALRVGSDTDISTSFTFPERTTPQNNFVSMPQKNKITISASSDRFRGAPIMALKVNGNEEGRVRVRPERGRGVVGSEEGAVRDYTFEVEGEIESLDIGFINDAYQGPGKDRNLFIHDIKINDVPLSETDGITGDLNQRLSDGPLAMYQNGSIPFDIEKYKADVAAMQNPDVEETDETEVSDSGEEMPVDDTDVSNSGEETPEDDMTVNPDNIENTVNDALAGNNLTEPESMVDFIKRLVDQIVNSILSSLFGITPEPAAAPQTGGEMTPAAPEQTQGNAVQPEQTGGETTTPAPTGGNGGGASPTAPTGSGGNASSGGGSSAPAGGAGSGGSNAPASSGGGSNSGGGSAPVTSGGGNNSAGGGSAPSSSGGNNNSSGGSAPVTSGGGNVTGEAESDAKSPESNQGSQTANGNGGGSDTAGGEAPEEVATDEDSAVNNGVDAGEVTGEEIDLEDVDTDSLGLDFGQFNEGDYDAGNCQDAKVINGVTSPFNSGDYCEALEKGLFFFYANRSGSSEGNPIEWRGDTDLEDGSDNGVDLVGGWYDAGDHIKFDLPAATSASMMAWSGIKFYDGYKQSGLLSELKKHLAWANSYFMKTYDNNGTADPADDKLFVQVGDGSLHKFLGTPEESTLPRKSYFVSNGTPATEVAAEKAAALTSFALLSQMDGDYDSADALATAAKSLYEYAYQFQGKYSDSVPEANPYYTSVNGYKDELAWGAAWLYKYTGDPAYLKRAEENYDRGYHGISFDEKNFMTSSLMYDVTGDMKYANDVLTAMDEYKNGQNGIAVLPGTATNGGLNIRQDWGSCNMTMGLAQSVVALAKSMNERGADSARMDDMLNWASDQADYCLGDNPDNFSYMIGFGENFPKSPHHRGANNRRGVDPAQYELTGAMVAGPKKSGEYNDVFSDWVTNEVGVSYNAPMVGTLGGLYEFAIGGAAAADDVSRDGVSGSGVAGLGIDRATFGNMRDLSKANTPNKNFNPTPAAGGSDGGSTGGGSAGGGSTGGGSGGVSGGEVNNSPSSNFAPTPVTEGTVEGSAGSVAVTKAPASVLNMCGGLVDGQGNGKAMMVGGLGHQYPEMGKLMNVHDVWEGATSVGIDAQGFFDSFTADNGNYNPGQPDDKKCLGALTVLNEMAAVTTMGGLSGDHGGPQELVMGSATNAALKGDAAGVRAALEGNGGDTSGLSDDLLVSMWSTNSHYYNHAILNVTLGGFKITHLRSLNDRGQDGNPQSTRGGYNDKGQWPEWEMYTKGNQFLSENARFLP